MESWLIAFSAGVQRTATKQKLSRFTAVGKPVFWVSCQPHFFQADGIRKPFRLKAVVVVSTVRLVILQHSYVTFCVHGNAFGFVYELLSCNEIVENYLSVISSSFPVRTLHCNYYSRLLFYCMKLAKVFWCGF